MTEEHSLLVTVCIFTTNCKLKGHGSAHTANTNDHLPLTTPSSSAVFELTLMTYPNTSLLDKSECWCAAVSMPGSCGREGHFGRNMQLNYATIVLEIVEMASVCGPQTASDAFFLHWNNWRDPQCEHFSVLQSREGCIRLASLYKSYQRCIYVHSQYHQRTLLSWVTSVVAASGDWTFVYRGAGF